MLGDAVFLVLAVLGLTAFATVMGEFFLVVKILGAAGRSCRPWTCALTPRPPLSHGRSLLLGFVVTLGNPKAILF